MFYSTPRTLWDVFSTLWDVLLKTLWDVLLNAENFVGCFSQLCGMFFSRLCGMFYSTPRTLCAEAKEGAGLVAGGDIGESRV
jgi:hypothetical protein